MIDWLDSRREDVITVQQIDPHDFDSVRGELEIIPSSSSISQGYYTDTRISAKLQTVASGSDGYIGGSWLRVIHSVPEWEYSNELGTFCVSDNGSTTDSGERITDYTLNSALYAMSVENNPSHFSISQGAKALNVARQILAECQRPYIVSATAKDYLYTTAKVYEMGDAWLSDMFDVCSVSGNRLEVDGHGRVLVDAYVEPSRKSASWVIDAQSDRSVVLSGGIQGSSDGLSIPGRSVVIYSNGDSEISAYADSTGESSRAYRGYLVSSVHQLTDMSPATQQRAQQLADEYLASDSQITTEWKLQILCLPIHEGDVVSLVLDSESHHCLVKSIDPMNLSDLTMTITLKEC